VRHWQVELVFKWIEQPLRVKTFFSVSVLVAMVKKEHKLDRSFNGTEQTMSRNLFERRGIIA